MIPAKSPTHAAAFTTEVTSIDLSAALIALNFPLAEEAGLATITTADLDSAHNPSDGKKLAWRFGSYSPTAGMINQVMADWSASITEYTCTPIQYCRLALHNRRCLMSVIINGAPLYTSTLGLVHRLSNAPSTNARQITWGTDIPAGTGTPNTDLAAAAITLGCPLLHMVRSGSMITWCLRSGDYQSLTDVQGHWRDERWIADHNTPEALVIALMHNYRALIAQIKQCPGELILRKGGKTAIISTNASEAAKIAAARHLNC